MILAKNGELPSLQLSSSQCTEAPTAVSWLQSPWMVYGLGIALQVFLFTFFWRQFGDNVFELASSAELLAAVLTFLPLHEALHGVMHRRMGLSDDTVVGLHRQLMAPFCIYRRPVSRRRAIATALAPTTVLSGLPAVLSVWGACPAGLAVLAVLNAAGCGIDLAFAFYAWRYLPRGSVVGYDKGNLRLVRPGKGACEGGSARAMS